MAKLDRSDRQPLPGGARLFGWPLARSAENWFSPNPSL